MTDNSRPTLAEERRDLARARILDAGAQALSQHGVGASVEDVARIAGVGRRTIFRYYATRDQLIAAVIDRIVDYYDATVDDGRVDDETFEGWVTALASRAHELNASLGNGYWQLLVDPEPPELVRSSLERRRQHRLELSRRLAERAWSRLGQPGGAPTDLVDAITMLLGPLGTAAMMNDGASSAHRAGEIAGRMLLAYLDVLATQDLDGQEGPAQEAERT